ncbi:hypothetical protein [Hyphomonas sp.]|uniref:hypothetical protein n=1 Tax=Hyphomonas sp. TaxID=87 RepID=UPI0025C3ED9B|nr:hypothetical protein [Hyphomonas sp.]MBA4338537.1 hypothetical protein [Hyphomonas sp.]
MLADIGKERIESALSGVGRDLDDMVGQGKRFVEGLDTTEQLVLVGLILIGLFYLVFGHFQGGDPDEKAGGRFVGIMFMMVAMAAGLGWMASDYAA